MKTTKGRFVPLAEINVTPFVDVMLVLLIIFMVTAPMMQQGVEVDLPKAKGKGFTKEARLIVGITKNKNIFIDNKGQTTLQKLRPILKKNINQEVLIKADTDVPYGFVMKVMAEIKDAGIEKVGMVTTPER